MKRYVKIIVPNECLLLTTHLKMIVRQTGIRRSTFVPLKISVAAGDSPFIFIPTNRDFYQLACTFVRQIIYIFRKCFFIRDPTKKELNLKERIFLRDIEKVALREPNGH